MGEDLYRKWFGVDAADGLENHYLLLGLESLCEDQDAIEAATRARLTRLDEFALHPDRPTRDAVQEMMNQVARARVCLTNPRRKSAYDEQLAARLGVAAPAGAPEAAPSGPEPEAEAGTALNRFEQIVWAHLGKWKLNPQEQRLLMAEAAELGIEPALALKTIRHIDAQAESRAAKKHRWLTAAIVACALLVVAAAGGVFLHYQSRQGDQERQFDALLAGARRSLKGEDIKAADEKLAAARRMFPEAPRLVEVDGEAESLRRALEGRFSAALAAAGSALGAGDFSAAERKLTEAAQLFPEDPRRVAMRNELGRKLADRRKRFGDAVTRARTALDANELDTAAASLAVATGLSPTDGRLAPIDRELTRKRQVRQERRERQAQELQASVAEAKAMLGEGKLDEAQQRLAAAEAVRPDDPNVVVLRRQLAARMRQRQEQQKQIALREKQFQVRLGKARELLAADDFEAAVSELAEAEKVLPKDPRLAALYEQISARMNVAHALTMARTTLERGDLDAAARKLAEAERLAPNDAKVAALRRDLAARRKADLPAWARKRAMLPLEQQVEATLEKLKEMNADPAIKLRHSIYDNQIQSLSLANNKSLRTIEPLAGLELVSLDLSYCEGLQSLRPLRGMNLKSITLYRCKSLRSLEGLERMPLTSLSLRGCSLLTDLAPLAGTSLTHLSVSDCTSLRSLKGIEGLPLKSLQLDSCESIDSLELLKALKLESLSVLGWKSADRLKLLAGMPLESLSLSGCSDLKDLRPIKELKLTALRSLSIQSCPSLATLDGIQGMPLERLTVSSAGDLASLDALAGTKLKSLAIHGCGKLRSLKGLQRLRLESLDLSYCTSLSSLEPLRGMNLTALDLSGCAALADLSGLERLRLTRIDLSNCKSLTSIAALSASRLESLSVRRCTALKSLRGIENSPITSIELDGCASLTDLDPLRGKELTSLRLSGCSSLVSLAGLTGMPLRYLYAYRCTRLTPAAYNVLKTLPTLSSVSTGDRTRDREILDACRKLQGRTDTTPRRPGRRTREGGSIFE